MTEINPLLLTGGVSGAITAILVAAYALVKDKTATMGFERTMNDGEIMRRLMAYAKPYRKQFVVVMFLMLFSIAYDIISPLIVYNFIIYVLVTSVMVIFGFPDFFSSLLAAGGASYLYFPSATVEMIGYLCMTLIASFLLRWIEKKMDGTSNYELVQEDPLVMTAGTYSHPSRKTPFDEQKREVKK